MSVCPTCQSAIPEASRFCPGCGSAVPTDDALPSGDADATIPSPAPPPASPLPGPPSPVSGIGSLSTTTPDGSFVPGTVVAERYRIVALLGRGGMGEVYRADDLTLGQSVALKFLPEDLARDEARRSRFFNEVRVAREVAHPNVCRVYDIGELNGRAYLSMEFVDGDDLALLLRRIGRLPEEKGLEIARQLCAGLGALHDRGVLHRDLKPANVMVDGRGRVRITDFGLAEAAAHVTGSEARAGTPAYMAPEQLAGKAADARSDIYALGLVLYEIFTGKRAFNEETLAEIAQAKRESTPVSVTTLLPEADPAIERVIARCLDKDPALRPPSAFAAAAALPGGDPIAAALAAGEVPSVEMVAAAGEAGGVKTGYGVLCMLAVLAAVILSATLNARGKVIHWDPMEKPPAVLADRARSIMEEIGYERIPADRGWSYEHNRELIRWLAEEDSSAARWARLRDARPAGVSFWYREALGPLIPLLPQGGVQWDDPPFDVPGMTNLTLDTKGRLTSFNAVPPDKDEPDTSEAAAEGNQPVDWAPLFAAAGLEMSDFEPTASEWVPPRFGDERLAWIGEWTDEPGVPVRIEAAAYRGKPVHFRTVGPWTTPRRTTSIPDERGEFVGELLIILVIFSVFAGASFLAIRNVRSGRGDRQGATRLAIFVFSSAIVIWVLTNDHVPDPDAELNMLLKFTASVAFVAGLFWAFYLALEPYVRKTMPKRIVSWSRVLTGRWRDPLVGRDILAGGVFFLFLALSEAGQILVPEWLGNAAPRPDGVTFDALLNPLNMIGTVLAGLVNSMFASMLFFLLLVLLRLIVRNTWVAAAIYVLGFIAFGGVFASEDERIARGVVSLVLALAWVIMLVRFGLLAFMVGFYFHTLISTSPLTTDWSTWYSGFGLFAALVVLAITTAGLWIALSGRRTLAAEIDLPSVEDARERLARVGGRSA